MTFYRMCFHILFLLGISFGRAAFAQAPASNDAVFNEAMKLYSEKNYLESARILRDLIRSDREKSLYWFNFGNCLFMMKRYESSVKFFNKVIQLNTKLVTIAKIYKAKALVAVGKNTEAQLLLQEVLSERIPASMARMARDDIQVIESIFEREDQALEKYRQNDPDAAEKILLSGNTGELSSDAQILLGMIYIKQNRRPEAQKIFFNLSRSVFLEMDRKEMVRDFLKRTRKSESLVRAYQLTLDVAVGNTSNAYLDGDSQELVPSTVTKANVEFSYRFLKDEPLSFFTAYDLNMEDQAAAPDLKSLNHTLNAGAEYDVDDIRLTAKIFSQLQNWNNQPALQKTGVTLDGAYQRSTYQYGIAADFTAKTPATGTYAYLKGEEFGFKPYFGYWTESTYTQLSLSAGLDNTFDIEYSDGSVLPLNQNYTGLILRNLWEINKANFLTSSASYTQRSFKTNSMPGDKKRTDSEIQLLLKYACYFLPNLSLSATVEHITNSSTLGAADVRDKNYKVTNIYLGILWDVFE